MNFGENPCCGQGVMAFQVTEDTLQLQSTSRLESRGMHHKKKAASWLSVDALGIHNKIVPKHLFFATWLHDKQKTFFYWKSFYWIGKFRLHQFAKFSLAWANMAFRNYPCTAPPQTSPGCPTIVVHVFLSGRKGPGPVWKHRSCHSVWALSKRTWTSCISAMC